MYVKDKIGKRNADAVYSHAREHMWDSERAVLARGCRALADLCRDLGDRVGLTAANENGKPATPATDRHSDAAD